MTQWVPIVGGLKQVPPFRWVYVAGNDKRCKIGSSMTPLNRVRTIEKSAGHALTTAMMIPGWYNALGLERELHIQFARHRAKGEWFDCSPQHVMQTARIEMEHYKVDLTPDDPQFYDRQAAEKAGRLHQKMSMFTALGGSAPSVPGLDLDLEDDMVTKVSLIREARLLFGEEFARQLWRDIGLPLPPGA